MTVLASFLLLSSWQTDFEKAKQTAQAEHKFILLNFSGSDWCGPCIRLHKDFFETDAFDRYAHDHLVLVTADFPRLKKNALTKDMQRKNDQLAEVYNKEGNFPLTLLLSSDGAVLKKWEGLPKIPPQEFVNEINAVIDERNFHR